jgi:hypothetical protein
VVESTAMRISSPHARARLRYVAWALGLVTLLCAAQAVAAPTPAERARSSELFREGRKLLNQGKIDEACETLGESHRLDPGGGTVLNLALCHAKQGKTASAWAEFSEGYEIAKRDRNVKRMQFAQLEIKKLEPKLSKLTVVVPEESRVEGLMLTLVTDEKTKPLDEAIWSFAAPIDPGVHKIEVTAPNKKPWSTEVVITADAQEASVTIPPLQDLPVEEPPPPPPAPAPAPSAPPPPKRDPGSTVGTIVGGVVGGLGVVGLGIGTYFGVAAANKKSESDDLCPEERCTAEGASANFDAGAAANEATTAFVIGGSAVACGVLLLILSAGDSEEPAADATTARIAVTPGAGDAGIGVAVRW